MQVMAAAPIQYAPARPGEKRRKILRRALALLVVLIVAPTLWRTGSMAFNRAHVLYWQKKALEYAASPDQVVLDITAGQGNVAMAPTQGTFLFAREWRRLNEVYAPPGRKPLATLFLHERKTPGGEARLVAVECTTTFPHVTLYPIVVKPGSLFDDLNEAGSYARAAIDYNSKNEALGTRFRFFAGQPDPTDATHFTIEYDAGKTRFVIDGYLTENNVIDFSTREKR